MKKPANTLIRLLQEQEQTLALAESMTCGLAAHQLSNVKGTSEVLLGSMVCYHESAKSCLLHVDKKLIKKYTAESQQVTDVLAKKLSRLIKADYYGAITGLASEGGSERKGKPVGTVFFSVYHKRKMHRLRKVFRGTPLEIRKKAVNALYELIIKIANPRKMPAH